MDKIQFTAQDDFPLTIKTMDFIQKMIMFSSQSYQIAGLNYILNGCDEADGVITPGIIIINGEVLQFTGGVKTDKIQIIEQKENAIAFDKTYPDAYIRRTAEFSDVGVIPWNNLSRILTNQDLENKINTLRGEAPGFVKMWSGLPERLEKEYRICNGDTVLTVDYPDLARFYGKEGESSFSLPDLRQRFVVGFDNSIEEYNKIGKTGGEKEHILLEEEMANHKHIMPWGENINQAWNPKWGYADDYLTGMRGSDGNDNDNAWAYTSDEGKGLPHENRPPFYVLAYVVKVKY